MKDNYNSHCSKEKECKEIDFGFAALYDSKSGRKRRKKVLEHWQRKSATTGILKIMFGRKSPPLVWNMEQFSY